MTVRPLPDLPDWPAAAAWLLGGSAGRPPQSTDGTGLIEFLRSRRLAGEALASARLDEAELPAVSVRTLRVERERVRLAGEARQRTLERAGAGLGSAGLEALAYKGVAVIALTHGDASRRPMADLDLLIRKDQRDEVRAALRAVGFRETRADTALHDVYLDPESAGPGRPAGVAIEIHVDVFPPPHPFDVSVEPAWERSRVARPGLRLPIAPDALVLTAFHHALYENDAAKGLITLRDVALLAEASGEEAAAMIAETARRFDAAPIIGELGRRAEAWAGGPRWLAGQEARFATARRRRAWATRWALQDLDAGIADVNQPPAARALGRKLAAALWHRSAWRSVEALARGLRGAPDGRGPAALLARIVRHVRGFSRAGKVRP